MSPRKRPQGTFPPIWLLALVIVTFLCSSPTASIAQTHGKAIPPTRIRFTTGAISAQVRGTFTPTNERVRYVIKAKKGDHMVINIIPVTRGLTMAGTVKFPSGQGDGGPGGIVMNSDLEETGDFTIEVNQHTMGSNYKSGSFILEVVITPQWLRN
jgi:hypothetical protein